MGGLLSVSLIAGGYFLHTKHAGRLVQNGISRNIPGAVVWQRHTLSLLQGIIEIENLSLKDGAGEDILFLPNLFLKISWLDITLGNLTFDSVILDQ